MAAHIYRPGKAAANATIRERLEARSIPEPNSGCILWFGSTGGTPTSRHGVINYKRRHWKAHRLAWVNAHGPIPDGVEVCHKCDVPECINVAHLFLGSHADNMADMVAKRRARAPRGEMHKRAKLTAEKVRAIRADKRTLKEMCADYGIGKSMICYIRAGVFWKHVL